MKGLLKKRLSIVLVLVLVLNTFALAGCKQGDKVIYGSDVYDYEDSEGQGLAEGDGNREETSGPEGTGSGGGANNSGGGTNNSGGGVSGTGSTASGSKGSRDPGKIGDEPVTVLGLESLKGKTIVYSGEDKYFKLGGGKAFEPKVEKVLADLQAKYDFKLVHKKVNPMEFGTQLITAIQSGVKFADIMQPYLSEFSQAGVSVINSKALRDLSKFPEFDLYNPNIYNQSYVEQTQVYGKNLFAFSNFDFPPAQYLFFNKKILKEDCGMEAEELYKMVRDGNWTISRLQALSKKAKKKLVAGADSFSDQYGFCGWDMLGTVAANVYFAAGGRSTAKNPTDGSYSSIYSGAESLAALKTMQTWLLKDPSIFYVKNKNDMGSNNEHSRLFAEGRSLFYAGIDYWDPMAAQNAALPGVKGFDWGIVPYPKVNEKAPYRSNVSVNTVCYAIPANNTRDEIALAGYLLKELIPQLGVINAEVKKNMRDKYNAYDPAVMEMRSKYIDATGYLDHMQWAGAEGAIGIIHGIMGQNYDPAQKLKEQGAGIAKKTAEFNKAHKDAK